MENPIHTVLKGGTDMSCGVSTLLTRNLNDVFGENARRVGAR
jgi:hypothetical protein